MSFVQIRLQVGRQNRHAIVGLHALQQIADLDICIAIMGITYFRALAEKSISLIKKENGVARLSLAEDTFQILFCFTYVLLTTPEKSILYRSSPSSPAMISATIVLPVPGGPEKSAVMPRLETSSAPRPTHQARLADHARCRLVLALRTTDRQARQCRPTRSVAHLARQRRQSWIRVHASGGKQILILHAITTLDRQILSRGDGISNER